MILEHHGAMPNIDATARIAPTAVICGNVLVGANTSIGFGAVLTAESGPIVIGANCVIMDTAVIRGTRRHPTEVGDNVLIGPRAYLSGCTVEDNVFLATGATVFNGARIGARAEAADRSPQRAGQDAGAAEESAEALVRIPRPFALPAAPAAEEILDGDAEDADRSLPLVPGQPAVPVGDGDDRHGVARLGDRVGLLAHAAVVDVRISDQHADLHGDSALPVSRP